MTKPRISIEVDFTRDGLLALRSSLDDLLGQFGEARAETRDDESIVQADRKVAEVWGRVGDNIKRFLTLGAELNSTDDAEFSMEQLAQGLGVSAKTVRSWHRNLGRTLRQVNEVMPEPEFMPGRWDGERQQYRFQPEVRSAILDRATSPGVKSSVEPRAALRAVETMVDSTPAVAISRAFEVLERRLQQVLADNRVDLPVGHLTVNELIDLAAENGVVSADTATALRGIVQLRNLAAHDPSGTRTTPDKAREFLVIAEATLFALESGIPA